MNSQDLQNLQEAYAEVYEGAAAEHPDIANQSAFQKKADEVLKQRQQRRAKKVSPQLPSFVKTVRKEEVEPPKERLKTDRNMFSIPADEREAAKKRALAKAAAIRAKKGITKEETELGEAKVESGKSQEEKEIIRNKRAGIDKDPMAFPGRKMQNIYRMELHMDARGEKKERGKKMNEKIDVGADAGTTISDFVHSKSATFKGDSKKQRIKRALGAYYATKRAQKEEVEVTEELENLEEKARGTRPKKTVHAYDVDETLVGHGKKGKPNVKVHVNDASGKRVKSLSNQEFNTHKLDKGHSYDFSEFRSAKKFGETSSANKKVIKDVKRKQARGQNVHIITARAKFDDPKEFQGHLKKKGVDVPINKIHYTGGMKGSDIGKKKVDVASGVAKQSGAKKIHMYDDAAKVHKAFEKEKQNKPTSTKIKTHLAKPNASGETTLRSYQGAKGGRTSDNPSSTTKQTQRRRNKARKNMGEEVSSYLNIEEGNSKGEFMSHSYQATKEDFDIKDKLFISFSGTSKAKNELKEESEMTPYQQWQSFIKENKIEEIQESDEIETELNEETESMTSYQAWKSYLESI